jgi:hypothetical protein
LGTICPLLHLPASAAPLCPDSFSTPEGSSQPGYDPLSEGTTSGKGPEWSC